MHFSVPILHPGPAWLHGRLERKDVELVSNPTQNILTSKHGFLHT